MTDDEWQAYVTREAARAVGAWLEARGRLHQPIAAVSRFVVLAAERIRERPDETADLHDLLMP